MAEKVINYSPEMVARLHEVYDGEASEDERDVAVAQLAEELGKSAPSVRMKLTNEGIYVAKTKAPAGKNTVRKSELVQKIADAIDMDVDAAGSLEKATKAVLVRILKVLD